MSNDGWRSTVHAVAGRWSALERDWQSVVVAAAILASIGALELQIPW